MRKLGQPFGLLLFTPVLALAQSSGQNYVKTETAYDLRGWLTNISTGSFTEELFYADGPGTALYNGNISSIRWKDNTQSSKRGYKFSYDTVNRLTSGAYGEGDALSSNTGRYSESMSYNGNGSLQADKSRGIAYITYDLNNNPKQIYFMNGSVTKYVYSASGQKLRAVHYTAKPNITRTSLPRDCPLAGIPETAI